jgi:N-methylhydantoinase A
MVSVPMVHLVTLGAGGGSICTYDDVFQTVAVGPRSAGSDPGPACYDRGGLEPTVTDADLLLGYLDPQNYAGGHIKLNLRRAQSAIEDALCDDLDMDVIETAKLIKRTVDGAMANGIATELRTRGYEPEDFTVLAYGGNGPLHACGIANALGVKKILSPPFSSVFSAVGAGSTAQMHIHEMNTWTVLFNANSKSFFSNYNQFNQNIEELERRGREDLVRQGFAPEDISYRLELDMRYGNQRVQTAVTTELHRLGSQHDVLKLIDQFDKRYGERFGEGSQATEAGVRINTIRVCSFVQQPGIGFESLVPSSHHLPPPPPVGQRACHFVGHSEPIHTPIYDELALEFGTFIEGPAVIVTRSTTYLVEPGWHYQAAAMGGVWFTRTAQ